MGTTKPRTPSSVWAQMMATLATEARPIQRLEPLRTQSASGPEPSRRAKVFMLPGSEPAVGSVRPKQPIASPAAICGSHWCFCSSEPCLWMALMAREPCTETKVRRPESPASSSAAGESVFHGGAAGAAVALQVHAEQAELGHFGHDLQREDRLLVPAGDVRLDRAVHKRPDVVAQRELGITQQRIEIDQIGFSGQVEPLRSEQGFRLDGSRVLPR